MSKIRVVFVLFFAFLFATESAVFAQGNVAAESVFFIRNYYQTLSVSFENQSASSYVSGVYGEPLSETELYSSTSYGFSSQEYDSKLGIYYFPSRIFSPTTKRYFQPDPKGQYVSPYLFVKADPVNTIDFNGKEGKTLVLYEQDRSEPKGYSSADEDLFDNIGDSYKYRLSDFVHGEIGDIPEWNGKVFIVAHTGEVVDDEIETEVGDMSDFVHFRRNASLNPRRLVGDKFDSSIGARDMGHRLGRFSKERGVPIKSVSINGCGSSTAAERMGEAFTDEVRGGSRGGTTRFLGVTREREAGWVGPKSSSDGDIEGLDEFQYFTIPDGAEIGARAKRMPDGSKKVKRYTYKDPNNGKTYKTQYTDADGLQDIIDARVPKGMEGHFQSFEFKY